MKGVMGLGVGEGCDMEEWMRGVEEMQKGGIFLGGGGGDENYHRCVSWGDGRVRVGGGGG